MKELTELPADVYRHLSAANIIGMLYYFIQDDIMDSPHDSQSSTDSKHHLALANLLYYEFLTSYQPYFPANSDFWSYFKTTRTNGRKALSMKPRMITSSTTLSWLQKASRKAGKHGDIAFI